MTEPIIELPPESALASPTRPRPLWLKVVRGGALGCLGVVVLLVLTLAIALTNATAMHYVLRGLALVFDAITPAGDPPGWAPGPWREWDIPTDPVEKAQYDFAHGIELPAGKPGAHPPEVPVSARAESWRYFNYLCATEAGEFIYRTVEGVDGVVQLRPRKHPRTEEFQDRYRMEDPAGWTSIEADAPQALFLGRRPWHYDYFESPQKPHDRYRNRISESHLTGSLDSPFWRYESPPPGRYVISSTVRPTARYGYTWRGIRRPKDRENGIAGGEVIVLDLQTGEVLAVRRSFTASGRHRSSTTGIHWEYSGRCPQPKTVRERFRGDNEFVGDFVNRVLISARMNEQTHEEN